MLHCISHVGIFTVRVGMLCVHMSCWHFVCAVSMLCLHDDILCLHDDILCLHDGILCMSIGMLCMNIGMLCMNIDMLWVRNTEVSVIGIRYTSGRRGNV